MRIVIAGGGIAGLTAALSLQAAGPDDLVVGQHVADAAGKITGQVSWVRLDLGCVYRG